MVSIPSKPKTHAVRLRGFTLIELLVVMAIIGVLAGLILGISGMVQRKGALSKAEGEIKAMENACEAYKVDNGIYPRGPAANMSVGKTGIPANVTDSLDPRTSGAPTAAAYQNSSLFLYTQLSGDLNGNFRADAGEPKAYFTFKKDMIFGTRDSSGNITAVQYIQDPFGYSYGYSTANAADQEKTPPPTSPKGYNATFDLWSTAGKTSKPDPNNPNTDITNQWVKNW